MISDNASTYLLAAEEVTALFPSQILKASLSKQNVEDLSMEVNRRHQDNSEEGPWTVIYNFYYSVHHCYLN